MHALKNDLLRYNYPWYLALYAFKIWLKFVVPIQTDVVQFVLGFILPCTVTKGFTVSAEHLLDYSLYLDENKVTTVDYILECNNMSNVGISGLLQNAWR